ncbi:MAG: hypothetical protein CL912_11695 [Deltaproteobacteria bacterium]|nr:hypothetical protein [Deltaproteobacteria bacterium]
MSRGGIATRLLTIELGDYVPVGYWSTIEVHTSFICACLPAIPPLFRREPRGHISLQNDTAGRSITRKSKAVISDDLPLLKVKIMQV